MRGLVGCRPLGLSLGWFILLTVSFPEKIFYTLSISKLLLVLLNLWPPSSSCIYYCLLGKLPDLPGLFGILDEASLTPQLLHSSHLK